MDLTPQQLGQSLYRLGRQLAERQRFEEARESFALSLEFQPEAAETCFELGNLLHAAGRHADAASHYLRAVELKPRFPQAGTTWALSACYCAIWAEAACRSNGRLR